MKGYPAWPAKVVEQQQRGGRYAVVFFGTLETANVKPTDIWPYDTVHTTKFCTEKNLARPLFKKGMEQMKQALEKEPPQVGGEEEGGTTAQLQVTRGEGSTSSQEKAIEDDVDDGRKVVDEEGNIQQVTVPMVLSRALLQ